MPNRSCDSGKLRAFVYGTDGTSLSVAGYTPNQFILGLDLEKAGNLGATHSGISTKDDYTMKMSIVKVPGVLS